MGLIGHHGLLGATKPSVEDLAGALVQWHYKGGLHNVIVSGKYSEVLDLSGKGRHIIQSNDLYRPSYALGINNKPTIYFNDSLNPSLKYLSCDNSIFGSFTAPYTCYVISKSMITNTSASFHYSSIGVNNNRFLTGSSRRVAEMGGTNNLLEYTGLGNDPGEDGEFKHRLFTNVHHNNGSSHRTYLNGVLNATGPVITITVPNFSDIAVGMVATNNFFIGDIQEQFCISGDVPADDPELHENLLNYIKSEYPSIY